MTVQHTDKVALITGGAQRIGASLVRGLHETGYRIVLLYHRSHSAAQALTDTLNTHRPDSVHCLSVDLTDMSSAQAQVQQLLTTIGRLDVLVNNAALFYPTPLMQCKSAQFDQLIQLNLKAPFFLAQTVAHFLKRSQGCIINMADIYGLRPRKDHAAYCLTKAGLIMATQALALELAPEVRVNAIAPGAFLWPEASSPTTQAAIINKIPLQTCGQTKQLAQTVLFLIQNPYITGQVITIDGGRSITI